MKNYFKEWVCIITVLLMGNMIQAQIGKDERMIKDLSFRVSYRPAFSTLPANTWFDRFNELNVLPIMIEMPINNSRFSLRFNSIIGFTMENDWQMEPPFGNWNPISTTPNHIRENAPESFFKTFGGEFSVLYYFENNNEKHEGVYVASNFGIALHPRYYYQTYKISAEIGRNWLSQNNKFCYGFGFEIGDCFRHSTRKLNTNMYETNNPIFMPKFSIGYIFN